MGQSLHRRRIGAHGNAITGLITDGNEGDIQVSDSAVEVRPATVQDAAGIARVHVEGWRFAYHGKLPQSFLDALSVESRTRFWHQAIAHPLPHSITLVAVRRDRIVGFNTCGPSRDSEAPDDRAEVAATYVDPAATRQGIGHQLMDTALDHLTRQRFHEVTLWVLDNNDIGRGFYEKYGWTMSGMTKVDTVGDTDVTEVQYRLDLIGRNQV